MFRPFRLSLFALLAAMPAMLAANNISVSNVSLTGKNTTTDTYQVQFDIGWDNSWRTSSGEANYDAAWIFIKFRLDPLLPWNHATLSATGHVQPVGATITVPTDLKGAFLFRSADGSGNVGFNNAQLQWNYGASGVPDNAVIEVRVMAIEMVQVPQGPFFIGDGTTTDVFRQYEAAQTGAAFQVTSEAAITLGGAGASSLNARNAVPAGGSANDDFNYTTTQTLPTAYPKGFAAFYAMKYELTEGQYVDFLNMLTATQAAARFPNLTGNNGHTVDDTGVAPDVYVTSAPERPCGGHSPQSLYAYADWSGLRPMSEFEYEKMCRGNRPAVANEHAWGTTALSSTVFNFNNVGAANEVITNPGTGAIANYLTTNNFVFRPWRSGIAPASFVGATRVQASAGYYGAMDLTGNLLELCISAGTTEARGFLGTVHGDGALSGSGASDIFTWPGNFNPSIKARGGFYGTAAGALGALRVSDRRANATQNNVVYENGIRLARTL